MDKNNIKINFTAPMVICAMAQIVFILLKVFGIITLPWLSWILIMLPTIILTATICITFLLFVIYCMILTITHSLDQNLN